MEQETYDLKEVSVTQLMGESIPTFCSGSFILKLNIKLKRLGSCVEVCCPAQGTVSSRNPSSRLSAVVLDSEIVPQGHLVITHSFSVTLKDVSFRVS